MTKYLINYGSVFAETSEDPAYSIEMDGDSVRLFGPEEWMAEYERYFANPADSGWGLHLEENDPLASFSSTYSDDLLTNDPKEFERLKKVIMDNGGIEREVSWKKTQS